MQIVSAALAVHVQDLPREEQPAAELAHEMFVRLAKRNAAPRRLRAVEPERARHGERESLQQGEHLGAVAPRAAEKLPPKSVVDDAQQPVLALAHGGGKARRGDVGQEIDEQRIPLFGL